MNGNLKIVVSFAVATLISMTASARTVIQNKGSDTLVNVAQAWAEEYQNVNSDVAVAVSGGGSGTGIAAMINGTVDIANASRVMKQKEIDLAKERGQSPLQHVVGFDALAVFVHQDNPLSSFSIEKLAEIFGEDPSLTEWSDLDIEVPGCKGHEIVVVSRQNNSGTYAYFRKAVLGEKRDFRLGTLDMHGSKAVVDLVGKTPCAIGYSGLAYATDQVKMLCLSASEGEDCVNPSVATASDNSYAVSRPIFMYTNGEPEGAIKSYLDWVLADEGQCIILDKGYAPVRAVSCQK